MSYDITNIIPINVSISPDGLGNANFGSACGFAPESELPVGFEVDTKRVYASLPDLSIDFADTTETYQMAKYWLSGTPRMTSLTIWGVDSTDATWTATLNKARNNFWWFYTLVTKDVYADLDDTKLVGEWCDGNESYFMNCQTGTNATDIRANTAGNIAEFFTGKGYRYVSTLAHATDPYAGIKLLVAFAKVNYSVRNSTITGEGKVLSGVTGEDLDGTSYANMKLDTVKCMFYTQVENKGSTDAGRVINSWSHSSYGEFMDSVINLASLLNALEVGLYNTVFGQTTKLDLDPIGMAALIGEAKAVCETYITNGYLGPRNYIDPDDGIEKYTLGYEILTQANDILDLSDADRNSRTATALRIRVFEKGAIHSAPVDIAVY